MSFPIFSTILVALLTTEAVQVPTKLSVLYDRNTGQYYMPIYEKMYRTERSDHEGTAGTEENANYENYYGTSGAESSGNDYHQSHQPFHSQSHENSGFQPSFGGHNYGSSGEHHQEISTLGSYAGDGHGQEHDGGYAGAHESEYGHGNDAGNNYIHSVPVSEHVEVTKPVAVPVYKEIGVPVPHPVKINVPHPIPIGVPQPYPVAVPVSKPFPVQIIKTVAVPVEKKVPYPIEKHIPVPIEKPIPITIERHVPVPVEKPYPIKIPVYKTIYHHAKSHGHGYSGHGHSHGH